MPNRLRAVLFNWPARILAGLIAVYLLLGCFAFEPLIKRALPSFVAERSGYRLQLEHASFNPLRLSVELRGLALQDGAGKALLKFDRLFADLDSIGLLKRTITFDQLRLERPVAALEIAADGQINWMAFIDKFQKPAPPTTDAKADEALPRLVIRHFVLDRARIDFFDASLPGGFKTQLDPLNLALDELSTLPGDEGHHALTARLGTGAELRWNGRFGLNPIVANGEVVLDKLALASLWPYVQSSTRIAPPEGQASLRLNYALAYAQRRLSLKLDQVQAQLKGLRIVDPDFVQPLTAAMADLQLSLRADATAGSGPLQFNVQGLKLAAGGISLHSGKAASPWLQLGQLSLDDGEMKLASREVGAAGLGLADLSVIALRDAQGRISLQQAFERVAAPAAASAASVANGPAWRYRLGKIEAAKLKLALRDESMSPAADLALMDMQLSAEGLSSEPKTRVPVALSLAVKSGGRLTLKGTVVPDQRSADLHLALRDLALSPAQPYLAQAADLALAGGLVDAEGQLRYANSQLRYEGRAGLRELAVKESGNGQNFLALKSLATRRLLATQERLSIGDLQLAGLDTKLIIFKDRSINVTKVLRKRPEAAAPNAAASASAAATSPAYQVDIDRIRLSDGRLDFADLSLALPFAARIHELKGLVSGLSTQPGRTAQIGLTGQVDEYGLARASGQVKLLDPTDAMDLKVVFQNVEMTSLTPYSATFAGRKIASGKLSLDLDYKLEKRLLKGENKVVMDQLTLGDRVASPTAVSLPLDLALALLQDSDGRIDLGLPVSCSLDDPQFSYGSIIWKAFVNVLTKIVTSPFRAIGALLGGGSGGEGQAPEIAFDPGAAELLPPEREKLDHLADALARRPLL
ncbi:MAG TPA: DUF748 domain-containing protein, partial [Burkholderiaceae bacterium]